MSRRAPRLATRIAGVVVIVFAAFPFLWMAISSLQPQRNLVGAASDVLRFGDTTLDAFGSLISGEFPTWLFNSMVVIVVVVVCNILFDGLAAYPLARGRFRGRGGVLTLIVLAIMIPAQVIALPLYLLMRDLGLLNTHLALILPYVVSPTGIFILRQHYSSLPIELEEAASVDGAGPVATFLRVIIPNSLPALGTVAILKFIWTWGQFAWPSLAITSSEMRTIPVGLASFQGQFDTNWPMIMAGSVLATIPPLLLFLVVQRWFVQGMTSGALKG